MNVVGADPRPAAPAVTPEWSDTDPMSCLRALIASCGGQKPASRRSGIPSRTIERWLSGDCSGRRLLVRVVAILSDDDPEERAQRVDLYARRVRLGLDPFTGRRPTPQRVVVEGEDDQLEELWDECVEELVRLAGDRLRAAQELRRPIVGKKKWSYHVAREMLDGWAEGGTLTESSRERVERAVERLRSRSEAA